MFRKRLILSVVCPVVFTLCNICAGYKLLMIPVPSIGHIKCMLAIADELDRRGHEVHMLSFDKFSMPMTPSSNDSTVRQFEFVLNKLLPPKEKEILMEEMLVKFTSYMLAKKRSFEEMMEILDKDIFTDLCPLMLLNTDESFQRLKEEKYDMAVVDGTMFTICFYLIPHRLGIPWITSADYPEPQLMRTPWLPSFVPQQNTPFTERMTFLERTRNTLYTTYLYLKATQTEVDDAILEEYRRYGTFETLRDLVSRSELFLLTSDIVLDYAKPSMPNIIEVGGLSTKEPGKLPDEFQQFMDAADKGVIVMTFGSMFSIFPTYLSDKFVSVFNRLDGYRVVWRMINVDNITIPNNVMISNWIPQNDILGHPKTKLFITYCGNNGQFEAVYNKVPMIGFPLYGDQEYDSKRIEYKGYGLAMNTFDFTADELLSNVQRILTDPQYARRVTRASDIFKSAAETPAERAAGWIEHVMTFGGSHLRSAGSDLPMYQYLLLDVILTIVVAILLVIIAAYQILYWILQKCNFLKTRSSGTTQTRKRQ